MADEFDLGTIDTGAFSLDDIDKMIEESSKGADFSNYFTGGGEPVDLGKLDSSAFSLDDIDKMLAGSDLSSSFTGPMGPMDEKTNQRFADELARYLDTTQAGFEAADLSKLPAQDFGGADVNQYMGEYQSNLQDIMDKGGYTSQWQTVGSDRIMRQDDGSAIGINTETGETYSLTPGQADKMVKQGLLNTYQSGYNTATGGTKIAPGGGTPVTLANGKTGYLMSDGRVIDTYSGKTIGSSSDVKTGGGGGGGGGGGSTTKKSDLSSLLPLLLLMMAMNRGSGSSGASSAVIPSLTATQRQTPYAQTQRAPGYRPGQGGITYFEPTQYTPKMAAGGIADLNHGRLLRGPGDGVSDSIPAMIGGMAGGGQPARLARGEYVMDARTVAALGNGSTDAGAERLDQMRRKILADDRKAGIGKDSKAYRHLA